MSSSVHVLAGQAVCHRQDHPASATCWELPGCAYQASLQHLHALRFQPNQCKLSGNASPSPPAANVVEHQDQTSEASAGLNAAAAAGAVMAAVVAAAAAAVGAAAVGHQ